MTFERIRYEAILAITGSRKGTNRNKNYEELGWDTWLKGESPEQNTSKRKYYNNKGTILECS